MDSIINGDFVSSSTILFDMIRSVSSEESSIVISSVLAELGKRGLMVRDHVVAALEAQPLYFSLRATSSEILTMTQTETRSIHPVTRLVSAIRSQLEAGPSILDVSRVDTDAIGSGEFSALLPHILVSRASQMRRVRIYTGCPVPQASESKRYDIGELWESAYGRMMLAATEVPARRQLVTSKEFSRISSGLADAGFEIEGMVVELAEDEWQQRLASLRLLPRSLATESEMQLLDSLFWAREQITYSNTDVVLSALNIIQASGSTAAVKDVQTRARRGPKLVRQKAIEVLATTRAPGNDAFLEELLRDRDDPLRPRIAQALSEMMSRPFAESAGIRVRVAALTARELPGPSVAVSSSKDFLDAIHTLLTNGSQLVHDEGLRVLSSLSVEERTKCLDHLIVDTSEAVRMVAANLAGSLPEDDARRLLERAAKDESPEVRRAAAKKANHIGLS